MRAAPSRARLLRFVHAKPPTAVVARDAGTTRSPSYSRYRPTTPHGSMYCPRRSRARPLPKHCKRSLISIWRCSPASNCPGIRPQLTAARPSDDAGCGRRPQGLRFAHRQAPALALDPVAHTQQLADMPLRAGLRSLTACSDISIGEKKLLFKRGPTCSSNIELAPLCKVEVTLPRVLGFREVRRIAKQHNGLVAQAAALRDRPLAFNQFGASFDHNAAKRALDSLRSYAAHAGLDIGQDYCDVAGSGIGKVAPSSTPRCWR